MKTSPKNSNPKLALVSSKSITSSLKPRISKTSFAKIDKNDSSIDSQGENFSSFDIKAYLNNSKRVKENKKNLRVLNQKNISQKEKVNLLEDEDLKIANKESKSIWSILHKKINHIHSNPHEVTLEEIHLRLNSLLTEDPSFSHGYSKKERLKIENFHFIPNILNHLNRYEPLSQSEKMSTISPSLESKSSRETQLNKLNSMKLKRNVTFNIGYSNPEKEKENLTLREKISENLEKTYFAQDVKSKKNNTQNIFSYNSKQSVIQERTCESFKNAETCENEETESKNKKLTKSIFKVSNAYNQMVKNYAEIISPILIHTTGDYSSPLPSFLNSTQKKKINDSDFVKLLTDNNVAISDLENLKRDTKAYYKELLVLSQNNQVSQLTGREYHPYFNFDGTIEEIKKARNYGGNYNYQEINKSIQVVDSLIKKLNSEENIK
jgi:hypothetical protein